MGTGDKGEDGVLGAIVDRYEETALFSGAVLVTRENRELIACARGFAHRGFSVPNAVDTRFDTAFVGKLFTAASVFRFVDKGFLDLDEPVCLPAYRLSRRGYHHDGPRP